MAKSSRRTKYFAQRQAAPWPAPATALVACVLFPCTVGLRALQASISFGVISGVGPLPPVTYPWMAWPVLMMCALWFRHVEGGWFPSAAVTGRAAAASAFLGLLDATSAALDFFATGSCGNTATRQGMMLSLLRASDIPLAAALSAAMIAYRQKTGYAFTVCSSVLFALPTALGLASAAILAAFREEELLERCDGDVLSGAVLCAALCRALRCACGASLLKAAGVENSLKGLFFVGGFAGFFGSMLVLPLTSGLKPMDLAEARLDLALLALGVFALATCEALGRLAVLRHSDPVTCAALDAGLTPLSTVMAFSTAVAHQRRQPVEVLALILLLFSFLVQHRLTHHCKAQAEAEVAAHPVLLGRASMEHNQKKIREI